MSWHYKNVNLDEIIGKTFYKIEKKDDDELYFYATDSKAYLMFHEQDCCESVYIEDIIGDLDDLINSPIIMAEAVSQEGNPKSEYDDSSTWTFYKFATAKGYVTIRWYGTSNGYYSESVDLFVLNKEVN